MAGCFSNPSYTVTVGAQWLASHGVFWATCHDSTQLLKISGVITSRFKLPVGNYSVLGIIIWSFSIQVLEGPHCQ